MMERWVDTHGSPKRLVWRVYGGGIYMDRSKKLGLLMDIYG